MDGRAATALRWDGDRFDASGDAIYRVLPRGLWRLFSLVWLFFLVFPIYGLVHAHRTPGRVIATLAGMAIIIAAYLWLMLRRPFPGAALAPSATMPRLALLVALTACVLFLTLTESDDWYWFFVYAGIAAGVSLPARRAMGAIAGLMVVAAAVGGARVDWLQTGRIVLLVAAGGFGMVGVGRLIGAIGELRAARAEIARLVVAGERLRFARDLHDLLGHSLSTIAIKATLAYRLLPDAPERAMRELDDVQSVTQDALREVREAVTGYRQPTLAEELANAREILAAAGIAYECDNAAGTLPTAVESVAAWAVREGVTNIVRHSRARHVAIRIHRERDAVSAAITDDGSGDAHAMSGPPGDPGGSGLRGLAERAAAVGGRLDAHPCPTGGFHLAVTLPIEDEGLRAED